jgi:hypothetical protein
VPVVLGGFSALARRSSSSGVSEAAGRGAVLLFSGRQLSRLEATFHPKIFDPPVASLLYPDCGVACWSAGCAAAEFDSNNWALKISAATANTQRIAPDAPISHAG